MRELLEYLNTMRSISYRPTDIQDLARWEGEGGRSAQSNGTLDSLSPLGGPSPAREGEPHEIRSSRGHFSNVLVATDFSSSGDLTVMRALHLPCVARAKLALLHVAHGKTESSPNREERALLAHRIEEARVRAASAADGLGVASLDVAPVTIPGKASAEIVRAARRWRSELVVLGRHGRSPMHNLFLGSTAKGVIRRAGAPVLVVSQPVSGPYGRLLVAVDFSETSRLALDTALRLADPDSATVDVVSAHGGRDDELPLGFVSTAHEQEARAHLEEFLRPFAGVGVSWNTVIERGDPREVILDAAAGRGCDLVVVGARGRSAIHGVLIESVAEAVVRQARCDVLVIRSVEDCDRGSVL